MSRYRTALLPAMALVLALIGDPVAADQAGPATTGDEQTVQPAKQDRDDEVVCHRERVTGSSIPQRVCRTRGQIRAAEAETQRLMREQMKRANTGTSQG